MDKLNVFFVSISAPPSAGPESLQVAKYIKYLAPHTNIHLITGEPEQRGWNAAESELHKYTKDIVSRTEVETSGNRYVAALKRKLKQQKKGFPDNYSTFIKQDKKVISGMNVKPDILYSRSSPFSAALLTAKLKDHYNVPWVMHFSDPWFENPYHGTDYIAERKAAEEMCVAKADLLTFTSEKTRELYEARYPHLKDKLQVMPNVYDAVDVIPPQFDFSPPKLKFVHTGNLYAKRTPATFIAALSLIKSRNPELLHHAEFVFAGHANDEKIELFKDFDHPCLQYIGHVSADESIKLQQSAHVLVFIDKPVEEPIDRVFFPSKVQDYMAAGKPMLGVSDPHTSSAEFVQDRYGKSYDNSDSEGLSVYIEEAITAYRNKNSTFFDVDSADVGYSAEPNALRLLNMFEQLC